MRDPQRLTVSRDRILVHDDSSLGGPDRLSDFENRVVVGHRAVNDVHDWRSCREVENREFIGRPEPGDQAIPSLGIPLPCQVFDAEKQRFRNYCRFLEEGSARKLYRNVASSDFFRSAGLLINRWRRRVTT